MKQVIGFLKEDKRIIVTAIVVMILIVLGTSLELTVGSAAFTLENPLKVMGKDVYENFYYDGLNMTDSEREEFLSGYQTKGLEFDLNYLVDANKEVNEEKVKAFVNPNTNEKCDYANTKVIIYPKSPYGRTDYDMEAIIDCGMDD